MDGDRDPRHPDMRSITLRQVLEAPADPVRRGIVSRPYETGTGLTRGSFDLPVGKPTATHHFRVLREAGLTRQYHVGTARMNALRSAELGEAFPGLLGAVLAAERAASARATPA